MPQFGAKGIFFEKIDKADADSRKLVFVGRTDAAPGGADLSFAAQAFACKVDGFMIRHDQMSLFADVEQRIIGQISVRFERIDLLDQDFRIDDDAVGDHTDLISVQRAGRNEVKNGLLAVYNERMTGVIAALEAYDDVGIPGK